ncbi:MAG TPA: MurR/RpiR family transcriptional regulator [Candidatus Megamonas gallistercoris]|nr:MurR/RpiR family transcriptional regulator [Candidatus Megamonas gallistercoris]
MFEYDDIKNFNKTEMAIYKYIIANLEKIPYMTIREIAAENHVSTTTFLRFCTKSGFSSYNDFKSNLKQMTDSISKVPSIQNLDEMFLFFKGVHSPAFEEKLQQAVILLRKTNFIIFAGIGSSGTLARYGARYFSNLGKFSVGLEDTHYPIENFTYEKTAVIAISESGETPELINLIKKFRQKNCPVLSITNLANSTLARLSDWNFSYNLKHQRMKNLYNITSQVPTLFIMESLACRL